jgi:hypothetical protein
MFYFNFQIVLHEVGQISSFDRVSVPRAAFPYNRVLP